MTTEEQSYWYPVTKNGVYSYLKTKTPKTQEYFELMIANPKACGTLKRVFVKLEKKRLSKTLEEFSSISEIVEDFKIMTKKMIAKQNWISKKINEYLLIPLIIGYLNSLLDVDLGTMREKEQEEFVQAMFLASVYLHL